MEFTTKKNCKDEGRLMKTRFQKLEKEQTTQSNAKVAVCNQGDIKHFLNPQFDLKTRKRN